MDKEYFALRLARLRQQKGVSAQKMSRMLGMADNYIASIENRKTYPSMEMFGYICEYLEITPQEFFEEANDCPERLRELMAEAQKLSQDSLELVLNIVRKMNQTK